MQTRNQTPLPETAALHRNGASADNTIHSDKRFTFLSLIGPLMPGLTPKVQPFESVDQGTETFLQSRIGSQERQRSELLAERQTEMDRLNQTDKWPEPDLVKKAAITLCIIGLVFLSVFSWLNGAQFVFKNFADTFFAGLLFSSVIPAIPFILKFVLCRLDSRWMEWTLAVLVCIGFVIFADQVALHFAKQDGLQIPTESFDFGSGATAPAVQTTASASVSLRWFFYGQLILECIGSYVFFTWLTQLLIRRRNPLWEEIQSDIRLLNERLVEFDNTLADLYRQQGELQHRKEHFQSLTSSLNELLK